MPRVDAYGEVDELNAWLGLVARRRPRRRPRRSRSCSIQRDLFALGAQLADPGDRIADRVTKAVIADADVARLEAADRSARSRAAAAAPLHPRRRHAGRRRAAPRAHRLPPRRAPDRRARRRRSTRVLLAYVNRLSDLLFVLARVVNHRGGRAGDRVVMRRAHVASRRSRSRLTASKTARASSCDTRSRIAPHSTSVVPVDRLDGDVPAIARDAFGPILEAGRLRDAALGMPRATRTAAIGEPLISTRTARSDPCRSTRSP